MATQLATKWSPKYTEYNLSKREYEVMTLISEGLTIFQISEKLFIGTRTVKTHYQAIRDKLGVNTWTQIAVKALKEGLVNE